MSRKHPWDFERACIESVGHSGWHWQLGSKSSSPRSWAVCPFIYVSSNFSRWRFIVFIVKSLLPHWSWHWHPEVCRQSLWTLSLSGAVWLDPLRRCTGPVPGDAWLWPVVRRVSARHLRYDCCTFLFVEILWDGAGVPSRWQRSFDVPEAPACQVLTVLMVGQWQGSSSIFSPLSSLGFLLHDRTFSPPFMNVWVYVLPTKVLGLLNQ